MDRFRNKSLGREEPTQKEQHVAAAFSHSPVTIYDHQTLLTASLFSQVIASLAKDEVQKKYEHFNFGCETVCKPKDVYCLRLMFKFLKDGLYV